MRLFCFLLLLASCPLSVFGQGPELLSSDSSQHVSSQKQDIARLPGLQFSGYIQPQWQHAEAPGIASYAAGNFPLESNNRFSIRRGRLRALYEIPDAQGSPRWVFRFEMDATEKGVGVRDLWGSWHENKWGLFALTIGMMKRPFGFEVTQSSSERETPERGRASQILMKGERDLGAMLSLAPTSKASHISWLRADLAVMNGPGISSNGEYDSRKDFILRIWSRPQAFFNKKMRLSGGVSFYEGGIVNPDAIVYENHGSYFSTDSASVNVGRLMPRRYFGTDVQVTLGDGPFGMKWRGEYLRGRQTGTISGSETPPELSSTLATRQFDAGYFYFIQNLGNRRHRLVLKYDWYDPNTEVAGSSVDTAQGFSAADVRYQTWGLGYNWEVNENLLLMLYYDHPINEQAAISGFANDIADDVFTARLQFRF